MPQVPVPMAVPMAVSITWQSGGYWSSTGSGSDTWGVSVDLDGSYANADFYEDDSSNPYLVLGCLAF